MLEHYLGRTLCTVAAGSSGSADSRFEAAVAAHKSELASMKAKDSSNPIIERLLIILNDEASIQVLLRAFRPNIYLVDLTYHFLYSSKVNNLIIADRFGWNDEDEASVLLEPGQFVAEPIIQSPIAFLLTSIYVQLAKQESSEIEATSLWVLFALCSVNADGGKHV